MKKISFCLGLLLIGLTACKEDAPSNSSGSSSGSSTATSTETFYGDDESDFIENQNVFNNVVSIVWNGASATVSGDVDGVSVTSNASGYVKLTSTAKQVKYSVSGNGTGQLKIYSDYKYCLSFEGLTLTNTAGPAISNQGKKTCFVVLSSTNTLTDASGYSTDDSDGDDAKAAFFSEGQLVFTGSGTLNVTGKNNHALSSDDYIRVREGVLNLTSTANDGMHTNDGIIINGGTITVSAADKGLKCDTSSIVITDGTLTVTAVSKGMKAYGNIEISGGTLTVTSTGSEGIESKGTLTISDGTVVVSAADDGINSAGHMYLQGGDITVVSSGNDGIDSNGNMYISGGTIRAFGTREPECGIDANEEEGYSVIFTGGTLLGVGGGSSVPSTSASTQAYILGSGSVSAGSTISLSDGSTTYASFTVPSNYSSSSSGGFRAPGGGSSSSAILITCAGISSGSSYTLTVGSTTSTVTAALTGSSSMGGGVNRPNGR